MASSSSNASNASKRPSIPSNDGAVDDGKKARTDAPAPAPSNGFALADFVAPQVVQFLGVRSLVRFGAACKAHEDVVAREVAWRKKCVAAVEAEVKQLMGRQPESVPRRENFVKAKRLVDEAKMLIDDEINFHEKLLTKELKLADGSGYWSWRDCDFFLQERKKFLAEPLGSLYLLPDCFYFPPGGDSGHPSQAAIEVASELASILSNFFQRAILHRSHGIRMSIVEVRSVMFGRNRHRMKRVLPFRKLRWAANRVARWAACWDMLDAFRAASRMEVFRTPTSRDCLRYTLRKMDKCAIARGRRRRIAG